MGLPSLVLLATAPRPSLPHLLPARSLLNRIAVLNSGSSRCIVDALSFVQPDHLGSTSQVADSSGTLQVRERSTAFGERRLGEEPKTTEYLYTGHQLHSLFGLYHYSDGSSAGRFVQPDSVTPGNDSQALNPYAYLKAMVQEGLRRHRSKCRLDSCSTVTSCSLANLCYKGGG